MGILIVIIIAVVIGGGVFFYIKKNKKSAAPASHSTSSHKGAEYKYPFEDFLKTMEQVFRDGHDDQKEAFLKKNKAKIKEYMKYPVFKNRYDELVN